jgi:hypothetical protein
LQQLTQRPLQQALTAGLLTTLTASYRDLYVAMDQFHKKDILGIARPLVEQPPSPSTSSSMQQQASGPTMNHTQMFYPIRDLTKLPDVPPPGLGSHLSGKWMKGETCWFQLLPNHIEMNYQIASGIYLWPAMEAFYPFEVDIPGMLQQLRPNKIRRLGRRRQRSNSGRLKYSSRSGWTRKPKAGGDEGA